MNPRSQPTFCTQCLTEIKYAVQLTADEKQVLWSKCQCQGWHTVDVVTESIGVNDPSSPSGELSIEIFEHTVDESGGRLEWRQYIVPNTLTRILIEKSRSPEVWGFDSSDKQHEGILVEVDPNVVLLA